MKYRRENGQYHKHYHYNKRHPLLTVLLWLFALVLTVLVGRFIWMFYSEIARMMK